MGIIYKVCRACFLLFGALGLFAYSVFAQTPPEVPTFTFNYQNATTGSVVSVAVNGKVDFGLVPLQQSTTVDFVVLNQGRASYTANIVSISGSSFSGPSDGRVIDAGGPGIFTLRFTAPSVGIQTATMVVQVKNANNSASYVFSLAGTGTSPQFVLSYILGTGGNQVAVQDQGTIAFPPTLVSQSSSATFVIGNNGNGDGTVSAITWTGAAFSVTGLTLLPTTVSPTKETRFTVTFTPTSRAQYTGAIKISLATVPASTVTINLTGQAIGTSFQYQTVINSSTAQVAPGGTITIPATNLGSTAIVVLTITNIGDADGPINSINIRGTGFTLTNLPATPVKLQPGQSTTFQISYLPTDSGVGSAILSVDNVSFNIAAVGMGARLQLAVGSSVVANNAVVNFPNTDVGDHKYLTVILSNQGNASQRINSIATTGVEFQLTNLPGLPITLDSGDAVTFYVWFTPFSVTTASGSLQIDQLSYSLRGAGTAPPVLPAITFTDAPSTSQALQQPQVGVTLANPYPYDVTGTLTLSFAPDSFVDDPAIQFAVGGRNISFTIPANSTVAKFGQIGNRMQFQTGTVSGTITMEASFKVELVDITPFAVPTKTVRVAPAAPFIRSLQLGTRNASGFELLITGYSNTRSMSSLGLQFSGTNLSGAQVNVPVDAAFGAWYQSGTSASFGSQFTASVFVNVNGKLTDVQSVSATLANSVGMSPAVSLNVQ